VNIGVEVWASPIRVRGNDMGAVGRAISTHRRLATAPAAAPYRAQWLWDLGYPQALMGCNSGRAEGAGCRFLFRKRNDGPGFPCPRWAKWAGGEVPCIISPRRRRRAGNKSRKARMMTIARQTNLTSAPARSGSTWYGIMPFHTDGTLKQLPRHRPHHATAPDTLVDDLHSHSCPHLRCHAG